MEVNVKETAEIEKILKVVSEVFDDARQNVEEIRKTLDGCENFMKEVLKEVVKHRQEKTEEGQNG